MKKILDNLHSVMLNWLENSVSVIFRPLREFQHLRAFKIPKQVRDDNPKKIFGFSLVELMISLIVISVVTAAFAPVVTKKLKTSDQSIGSASVDYIFDESICSSKKANCSVCVGSECLRCRAGYYINDGNCIACDSNCITCDHEQGCKKCSDGYYLDGTTCKTCPTGCAKCTNAATCTQCNQGYYISGTVCNLCDPACVSCSPTMGCLLCRDDTQLSDKNCSALSCKTYQYKHKNKCLECNKNTTYFSCNENGTLWGCADSNFPYFSTYHTFNGPALCCASFSSLVYCSRFFHGYNDSSDRTHCQEHICKIAI